MPVDPRSAGVVALELAGLIYDSVDDASHWPAFLESFVRAVGASHCVLLLHDMPGVEAAGVRWVGWTDEDIQLYFDRYFEADPLRAPTFQTKDGGVAADYELCPREELERSVVFREFLAPRDCTHSMGGMILTTQTGQSMVTCHRGAEAGPFGERETSILRALMPHLKRAALLHGEMGSLRRQVSTFTSHLERYPYPFLLTDGKRRVLYSNAAAREVVAEPDGLAIDNGRLAAVSPRIDAALGKAMAELAASHGAAPRHLEVPRPSRRKPYRLILLPIDDSRTMPLGVAVPAVSILIIDAVSLAGPDPEVLRELFSLTPAEARVSAMLVLGQNAKEIASESKTSVETARTHIKRVFSKTGTTRQSEFVFLVLRSIPFRPS
jgi:DNA-binding CsgD family transcriptional regulator